MTETRRRWRPGLCYEVQGLSVLGHVFSVHERVAGREAEA